MVYCLAHAHDENDFERNYQHLLSSLTANNNAELHEMYQQQIQYSKNQLLHEAVSQRSAMNTKQPARDEQELSSNINNYDTLPLPTTLSDALRPCKNRAIVITEAVKPYRIVNVNECWITLCGYSHVESYGKTLGTLIHGPETNVHAATTLISQLLQGESDVGTTLINYKKGGQKFRNRIRVGPLYNDDTTANNNGYRIPTHFVGVLQEVQPQQQYM